MAMAQIDSYSFGTIVVGGRKYHRDVLLLPDGTVEPRAGGICGIGSHLIGRAELEALAGAETVVVGIGRFSRAGVSQAARRMAQADGLELIVLPSRGAVEAWNRLAAEEKKAAAIIHVTC